MDWCGHKVLACAVDMRIFVEAEAMQGNVVEVSSFSPFTTKDVFNLENISWDPHSDLRYIGGVLKAFQKKNDLPYTIRGAKTRLLRAEEAQKKLEPEHTKKEFKDLPVSKGLSSSAAMCVAISAAIDLAHRFQDAGPENRSSIVNYVSKPETSTFYADMAYTGERKELGVNCGQMDQYASAFGGILHIDCTGEPAKVNRLKPRASLPLVIGDTRQPKDTPKVLGWLGERFKAKEPKFIEGMKSIIKIVEAAKNELEKQSPSRQKIGELMNENQHYLKNYLRISGDCPVSPSRLDEIIDASLKAGALGAKLSGSGGGGCMIALCEPGDETKIARAIYEAGGEAHITKVADQGVRIESLDFYFNTFLPLGFYY
jgi:mevalonate kinase